MTLSTKKLSSANSVGVRLKTARKAKRLSLQKLGELLNVSPSHLSRLETGKVIPGEKRLSRSVIPALCRLLDLPDLAKELGALAEGNQGPQGPDTSTQLERAQELLKNLHERSAGRWEWRMLMDQLEGSEKRAVDDKPHPAPPD